MEFKPFFINSNICLENDDISTYEKFMTAIAGNTGNSYITYALIKELFGGLINIRHIQNIYEYNFDNSDADIEYINNEATHVFLILQDQIRISESYGLKLPYNNIINFISKLNKPIIIAGLGANSFNGFDTDFHKKLDPNLIDFLKFLSDHCIEIGIRGYFTAEVLHKIGIDNINVIGCPSFYEMGKNRIINKCDIEDLRSIVLTSSLPICVSRFHKVMQDYIDEKIIKTIAFNRICFDKKIIDTDELYYQQYHIFSNIKDWKYFLKNFKFAIGYRVHGSILALNSGVPALCLNGDSRAAEMCNFLHIPHNANLKIAKEKDLLEIYEELDYTDLNSIYPRLYDNFTEFLHKNNVLLYEENKTSVVNEHYIEQPSLTLYGRNFFTELNNYILFNKSNFEENYKHTIKSRQRIFKQIFSVTNEGTHKVLRILGIKMKFRRKNAKR